MKKLIIILVLFSSKQIFSQSFDHVNQEASYKKGGFEGLVSMISNNFNYPKKSQLECKQGKINVTFIVTKKGTLDSVYCINHIDPYIDSEAIRLIMLSDKNWIPAKSNGKKINQRLIIPITFDPQIPKCKTKIQTFLEESKKYYQRERDDLVLEETANLLELEPSNLEALKLRGMAYQRLGNLDSACVTWYKIKYLFDQYGKDLFNRYCEN